MANAATETLLDALTQDGRLNTDQRRIVEIEHARCGDPVERLLLECGFVPVDVLKTYGHQLHRISVDPDDFVPDAAAVARVDEATARRCQVLPLAWRDVHQQLLLAVCLDADVLLKDQIRRVLGEHGNIAFRHASAADIAAGLDRCYGHDLSLDGILDTSALQVPVARLLDAILDDAVARRATDIHLEPEPRFVRLRYRIDGVLTTARCLPAHCGSALVVRLKVLGSMDIAETRAPQDGHISKRIHGEPVNFRVSSFPLIKGEKLVLRVLDRRRVLASLSALQLSEAQLSTLRVLLAQPEGLLIVAGPTGSGKSTTLHALLGELDASALNIMTLEDPVEHPLTGITQTSIDPGGRMDYADGVRALLRQDPDVLMIGEIRDAQSCAMAIRAAMSGHRVLSTVHAADTLGALRRLAGFSASADMTASVLTGVVAQRLLRLTCPHCVETVAATDEVAGSLDVGDATPPASSTSLCRRCLGTGYSGRRALLEILPMGPEVAAGWISGRSEETMRALAQAAGRIPLRESAWQWVADGLTSPAEVGRVFGP